MTANPDQPAPTGRRPADTFGNRLLLTRALAGHLSIREAADQTDLNREAWRDWERGRRPRDILDVCRRIADTFNVDHDWLLFGGELAQSNRPVTKRPGEATLRKPPLPVRPADTRPIGRAGAGQPRTVGPTPRRPVRISSLQVA